MKRDAAVSRIQQTLGFRSDQATAIVAALQDAQVELEESATLPWFLLTDIISLSTIKDDEKVALPADFLQEWEGDPLHYFSTVAGVSNEDLFTALAKDDLEFLRDTLPGTGPPQAYALVDKFFYIFPTPDDVYTLKNIYYKKDAVLTSDIENLWLEHIPFLLIGIAGVELSSAFRDTDALKMFAAWSLKYGKLLIDKNEAREHSSRRYVMGGPD